MQKNYRAETDGIETTPTEFITAWGGVLLAIRRDLRYRKTKLTEIDMLRYSIKDIDEIVQR